VKYIKEYFMMFYINVITVFLSLLCVSCGGGGDSTSTASTPDIQIPVVMIQPTVFAGVFLDSAVEGLSYTTATNSGITNTFGEFSYQTNEDVTFSIGDIIFPAFAASSLLTPLAVIETDNINHPSVINVL